MERIIYKGGGRNSLMVLFHWIFQSQTSLSFRKKEHGSMTLTEREKKKTDFIETFKTNSEGQNE